MSTDLFIERLIDGSEGKQLLVFISWGCGRQGHLLSVGVEMQSRVEIVKFWSGCSGNQKES